MPSEYLPRDTYLYLKTNNSHGFAFVAGPVEAKKKSSTLSLTPLKEIPVAASQKSQKQIALTRTPVAPGVAIHATL